MQNMNLKMALYILTIKYAVEAETTLGFIDKIYFTLLFFAPEGQFETNVGQNSQCVKLAFIFAQQAK